MWRLHRLACLAGLFLLVGSAELECPNCHEIHDSRSPGYDGRPPLPADTDMVIEIRTDVFATDGVSGYTTWRLNADIGGEVQNLYALFADANHSISLPAAYQVPTPFGADVGGTNPQLWQFKPETQYDSWLTVSSDDGSAVSALGGLSTTGISFGSWSVDSGIEETEGAIFWLDKNHAPEDWPVLLGQLTVPTGTAFSGLLNARGMSRSLIGVDPPPKVADWTVYCIAFGTDPTDVGLRPDANGHCSKAQDPPDQTPQPPPPSPGKAGGSCDQAGLQDRMQAVQDRCCIESIGDGGQESVCAYGKMPTDCDVRCAEAFLPFWADCSKVLAFQADLFSDLGTLEAKCHAAQEAEEGGGGGYHLSQ
jgi:hypothetical protein|eukprot:COSAG06_NODE_222_length_19858_cov_7.238372_14_plen_364_part_00